MQWSNQPNAGFSPAGVETWLPVNPNHAQGVNVAQQQADPGSLLNFYKAMIRVRKANPALLAGSYEPLLEDSENTLAFLRISTNQKCLVLLNFSGQVENLSIDLEPASGRVIFSNRGRSQPVDLKALQLAPFEILIAGV